MKKHFIIFLTIIFAGAVAIILAGHALAQEVTDAADIQYPVAELGNCQDKADCKSYCDKPENTKACVGFAEKNNLMSEEEIKIAKNFLKAGNKGPGGCATKDSCMEYCNDISRIDECISFAEKNNLMSPADIEEAKKIQAAIAKGIKPPPCGNKKACDAYCEDAGHMEECITFAQEAGFLQGKELEDAQKMLEALKRGVKAPPCKGKEACDEYCGNPDNMELCMNFAMEAGFMSEQEKADSQKMLQAIKNGVKPPNCKGKEECNVYCSQEEHIEECINFSVAAGFMSAEDAEMARKTGGKGPGGCVGKEECEAFCNNPDNQQTCFNFAKDNGMISEKDLKQMEEGKEQFKQSLEQSPPAVMECLNSQLGAGMVEKFKSGEVMPSQEIGESMRACYEQMGPPQGEQGTGGPGAGGNIPPAGQTGPGGCTTEEECRVYCESNPQACQNSQVPIPQEGQINPGCTTPEECQQIQNQMVNPVPCEGENCQQYLPPSGEQPGSQPGDQIPGQQPPEGGETYPNPPESSAPMEQQQQQSPYVPPETQPPAETTSPPTGFSPNTLLGSIINILNIIFNR